MGSAPWWGQGAKPPQADAFFFSQRMYFLVNDDRKANDNSYAWKYFVFWFSIFFKPLGPVFAPPPQPAGPVIAPPAQPAMPPTMPPLHVMVDECASGNHDCDSELGICEDTADGYNCSCKPGYEGDGKSCKGRCSVTIKSVQTFTWITWLWSPILHVWGHCRQLYKM